LSGRVGFILGSVGCVLLVRSTEKSGPAAHLFADDLIENAPDPFPGQPDSGPDAMVWLLDKLRTAMPDLAVQVDDVITDGEKVVTPLTWTGTQTGALLGADPTGTSVSFQGIDIISCALPMARLPSTGSRSMSLRPLRTWVSCRREMTR
jgi:hypothetical protein